MKTKTLFILIAISFFSLGFVARENVKGFNYEITPPPLPKNHVGTHRMYFLPTKDKFAANISVMTQPFDSTIQDYERQMKQRDKRQGYATLISEINDGFLTRELRGTRKEEPTHWYQRAIVKDNTLYMITATGREKHWEEQGPLLKASVDSFRFK